MKKVIEKCKKAEVYMYLIPSMVIFSIFLFYPFFKTIYLSLYKTNKLGEAKLYVGLDNYKSLLSNPSFYNSLWVTLEFVAIVVVGSMALGLLGAVLCSKAFPGIRVFSTSYALPMAVASSSGAMIFKIILNPTIGIVNKLLHVSINWVSDPKYALIVEKKDGARVFYELDQMTSNKEQTSGGRTNTMVIDTFIDCLLKKTPPAISGREALKAIAMADMSFAFTMIRI